MIKWDEKNKFLKRRIILNEAYKHFTKIDNNSYTRTSYHFESAISVLSNLVIFGEKSFGLDKYSIIKKAVIDEGQYSDKADNNILIRIKEIVSEKLKIPERKFHVLTSLSILPDDIEDHYVIDGIEINIIKTEYPSKYDGRIKLLNDKKSIIPQVFEDNYSKVIIKLKGKFEEEVIERSLNAIDLLRSVWCLFGNYEMGYSDNIYKPINRVLTGTVHSLHFENGNNASKEIWYEPNPHSNTPFILFNNKDAFNSNTKWLLSQLNELPYRKVLKESLKTYVRAFDEKDPNVSLIRLWGALEKLLLPETSKGNSEPISKRCAFLFEDYEYHIQVIENIRLYRNSNVYNGINTDRVRVYCYQLQFYFKKLVIFLSHNDYDFKKLNEAQDFLDMPYNEEKLSIQKKNIQDALNFRHPKIHGVEP
ncbi:MAG: hypothetical protein HRU38_16930 [Saccharospirillaceae bacterium]|nr:hypothetical protein [Pseudomonadales bacterium]NRB80322.1 hypothetical protein [Saccharospirillaceae bacterium]